MFLSPHTEPSYRAIVCEQAKLGLSFQLFSVGRHRRSFLPRQPLRPQHLRLVVRLLSHSLSPLSLNSARTRPFVLTTLPSHTPLSVSKRRKRMLRPAAASGHLPPPSADSTPHILRKPPQIVEELEDRLGNCMEEVLGLVRSSLTVPPPSSSPATAIEAELALPMELPLLSPSSSRSERIDCVVGHTQFNNILFDDHCIIHELPSMSLAIFIATVMRSVPIIKNVHTRDGQV
jgi:hypothetical protein